MKYNVEISEQASDDLENLAYAITEHFKSPLTAVRYLAGIEEKIRNLSNFPLAIAPSDSPSLLKYGFNVRHINYKKMTIIYTVSDNTVYVERVIASSLIID